MKNILCRLGFHKSSKTEHYVNHSYKRKNVVTSRCAFCERCGKRMYKVDKYGNAK